MTDVGPLHLVDEAGLVDADGAPWLNAASVGDHRVLRRARGPVLDVGCGPGRHVQALARMGVEVLGIDVTPSMLETASGHGAAVLAVSVFEPLPRMGQWQTALLLDGNSGLGGNPVRLLRRLGLVLCPGGRVLADLATGPRTATRQLRLRHGQRLGPDFAWAPLHLGDLDVVAEAAGYAIVDTWRGDQGWLCELANSADGTDVDLPRAG